MWTRPVAIAFQRSEYSQLTQGDQNAKAIVRAVRAVASTAGHCQTPNAFRRVGLSQGGSLEGERLSDEVVSSND
jgi:hypothetical protein